MFPCNDTLDVVGQVQGHNTHFFAIANIPETETLICMPRIP